MSCTENAQMTEKLESQEPKTPTSGLDLQKETKSSKLCHYKQKRSQIWRCKVRSIVFETQESTSSRNKRATKEVGEEGERKGRSRDSMKTPLEELVSTPLPSYMMQVLSFSIIWMILGSRGKEFNGNEVQ